MEKSRFVYMTYIAAAPAKIWKAIIDPATAVKYWQHENVSDWKVGSKWEHRRPGPRWKVDLVGKVLEFSPPRRLVLSWAFPEDEAREKKHSRVTLEIKPYRGVSRVTLTHDRLEPDSDMLEGITDGWPKVLSSLKSMLETGKPLPKLW